MFSQKVNDSPSDYVYSAAYHLYRVRIHVQAIDFAILGDFRSISLQSGLGCRGKHACRPDADRYHEHAYRQCPDADDSRRQRYAAAQRHDTADAGLLYAA